MGGNFQDLRLRWHVLIRHYIKRPLYLSTCIYIYLHISTYIYIYLHTDIHLYRFSSIDIYIYHISYIVYIYLFLYMQLIYIHIYYMCNIHKWQYTNTHIHADVLKSQTGESVLTTDPPRSSFTCGSEFCTQPLQGSRSLLRHWGRSGRSWQICYAINLCVLLGFQGGSDCAKKLIG